MDKGETLPAFELKDQDGKTVSSQDLARQPLVIYFYPKDDSPGCTKEACSFRDAYQDFKDAGARVVGISSDNMKSHKAFAEKHNLPFTLLADTDKTVRKQFGVKGDLFGLIPGRETFVFDKEGKLVHKFRSATNMEAHIKEALEIVEGG